MEDTIPPNIHSRLPQSTVSHTWRIPSPHTFHSYSFSHQLGHSWKIPSLPHTHDPAFLSASTHCGSFMEDIICIYRPSFISPPSTVAHSLKIPFPHTIHSSCSATSYGSFLEHAIPTPSIHQVSPVHCGIALVDTIFPDHPPFLSIPQYYGSFLEESSFHTIHLSSLSPPSTIGHS